MVLLFLLFGPEVPEAQVDEAGSVGGTETVTGSYKRFVAQPFFESVPARSSFGLRGNPLDAAFAVWTPGGGEYGRGAYGDGGPAAAGLTRSYLFGSWSNLQRLSLSDSVIGTPLQFGLHLADSGAGTTSATTSIATTPATTTTAVTADSGGPADRGTSVAAKLAVDARGSAPADGPRPESVATPPQLVQDDEGTEYRFYPETRMLEFSRAAVFQWSTEAMLVAPMFGSTVGFRLRAAQALGDPDNPDAWIRDNFTRTTREYRNEPDDNGVPAPVLEQTFTETSTRTHSTTAINVSVPFRLDAGRLSRIEPRLGYRRLERSRSFEQQVIFAGDLDEPRSPANAVDSRTDVVHGWNVGGAYELRFSAGWRVAADLESYGWITPDATAEDTAQQLLYDPNTAGTDGDNESFGPRDETTVREERRGRMGLLGNVGLGYRFGFAVLGRLLRLDTEPKVSVYHRREPTVRYDLVERRTRHLEGTPEDDGDFPKEQWDSATERRETFTPVGPAENISGVRLTSGARLALPVAIEARLLGGGLVLSFGGRVSGNVAGVSEYGRTYRVEETTVDLLTDETVDETERRADIPSYSRDTSFDLNVDVRAGIRTGLAGGELSLLIDSGAAIQSIEEVTGQVIFALPLGR